MWYICIARGYHVASNVMVHEIAAPIQSSAARGVTARDAQLLHIDAASASSRYTHQYCITVSTLSESSSSERLPQRPNPGYFHMMVIQKAPENRFCERWLPDLSIAPSPLRGCTSVPPSGLSIRIIPFPAVLPYGRTRNSLRTLHQPSVDG